MSVGGRPEFKPTVAQRDKVELCSGCGMTHEAIARVIGIAKHTLEKHFPDELSLGPARKHAEAIELLQTSARNGNVSAQKKLVEITATSLAAVSGDTATAASSAGMGKKEQAQMAAKTAAEGTAWEKILRRDADPPIN